MFLSVARLRLLAAAFSFLPLVCAHQNTIFTSSVSYCAPPENLLVEQFDIAYFPANNSLVFNVTAASVQADVNVTANLFLNVYGLHPVNITIDICSLFNGALCPLPLYNFSGSETLMLPSSINIASRLPGIAYKIPDLEAFAQLTLTEVKTGELKACVQSTLSNGWSTHQPGVAWGIGGLAFLALFSAAWQSFIPESLAPYRLLDLLGLYQLIASSGFLDLNYPVVYRAFTINFSWAMGLFSQSPTSSMQRSITNMRHLTGGNLADSAAGGSIALVNRKLSPYNTPVGGGKAFAVPSTLLAAAQALPKANLAVLGRRDLVAAGNISHFAVLSDVQTVTQASSNVLEAGVPIYVNFIGIATANAFMTAFFSALILAAITVAILGMIYGVVVLASREERITSQWLMDLKARYPVFARTWALRIALICYFPLVTFTFYQWSLKDSWLSVLISVITFLAILGSVGYAALRVQVYGRRGSPYLLSTDLPDLDPLYGQFRTSRYFFFALPLAVAFLRSLLIAAAKTHGNVQIIFIVVIEVFFLLSLILLKPGKTRRADVFSVFIGVMRLLCAGLLIAFIESINLAPIPRVVIGIIVAVLYSVTVIVAFLNTLWNLGIQHVWTRRPFSSLRSRRSEELSLEKSVESKDKDENVVDVFAVDVESRPRNPTPTHNQLLDTSVRQTYPTFTPTTTAAEPSSAHSTDTTVSYGHQIPSRWRRSMLLHSRSSSNADSTYTRVTPLTSGSSPVDETRPPSPSRPGHSRQSTIQEERVIHL
ncbi:TRP-domain-containing protein [Artomyces pyxidatus]|uniref:TRP-domain-containing protein n=1 Tax=Artomyces pyxidatus TaxID=48021 RepID=A0ACB8T341_9AGAM|nr:TRP-domain-containing protein [Artomyces pyxidatus]